MVKIALPLVEVHLKGYWPRHEQTKQNTIIDLPRQRFGEYNFASIFSQPPLFTYANIPRTDKRHRTQDGRKKRHIEVGTPPKSELSMLIYFVPEKANYTKNH